MYPTPSTKFRSIILGQRRIIEITAPSRSPTINGTIFFTFYPFPGPSLVDSKNTWPICINPALPCQINIQIRESHEWPAKRERRYDSTHFAHHSSISTMIVSNMTQIVK